ncbi:MAG: hypothetical protein ACNA8P_02065, partial [Phycisphaerales bacterium]
LDPSGFRRIIHGSEQSGGTVLVIDNLSEQDTAEAREGVDWMIGHIEASGLDLRGLGDDESDIEFTAQVRTIVGVSRILNVDHSRLREWLGATPELDSLIWIESRRDFDGSVMPGEVRAVLISETGESLKQVRLLQAERNARAAAQAAESAESPALAR